VLAIPLAAAFRPLPQLARRASAIGRASARGRAGGSGVVVAPRRLVGCSDNRLEGFEDLGGVAVGLDVVPGPLDPAVLADQEG
jgi:hypothetical protein